ncbi:MAG: hypothetical protein NC823_01145, partial [Candidatus Omnitrophica bacterium]|nr:hypothetical protein [Candidatus Omnitrophota bacterium]
NNRLYPGRRLYCGFLYPPAKVEILEHLDVMVFIVMDNTKLVVPRQRCSWREDERGIRPR